MARFEFYLWVLALTVLIPGPGLVAQAPDLYDVSTLRTFKITFKQNDWWQQLTNNYGKDIDIPADLDVDGKVLKEVGVRFRGTSSYRFIGKSQKKSFNITIDSFVPNQELYDYKNLNLSNSYNDPTFLREVVAYELMRRYTAAPKVNYVKLVLNNENWGIYVNVQQPDKQMMREWFKGNDGNRFRADMPTGGTPGKSALQWLGSLPEPYKKAYELKSEENPDPWTDLIKACEALNQKPAAQIPPYINVDRALWYIALNNTIVNLDSYIVRGNDYYIYFTEEHHVLQMIPWDMNESFGGFNNRLSVLQLKQLSPYYMETSTSRPILNVLLAVPAWRAQYLAHIRTFLKESFNAAELDRLITKHHGLIAAEVALDTKKLYTTAQFTQNLTQDIRIGSWPYSTTVPGLKPLVADRAAYLNAFSDIAKPVPAITQTAHAPAEPDIHQTVWVTARVTGSPSVSTVELAYTTAEVFTTVSMFDDGMHHDGKAGDGVFGASIPPSSLGAEVRYYLRAQITGGGMALDPPRAERITHSYTVKPPTGKSTVQIHEFLARNRNGIKDEMSEAEDWIEILNTGTTAVDLSGFGLSDNVLRPDKWKFPQGTVIQPGKTLLIWADDEGSQGPLHAAFKLSGSGEEIALFAKDGKTLLDSVTYGPQQEDVSTGRLPGHPGVWASFPDPTPYRPNQPDPCGHLDYHSLDLTTTPFSLTGLGSPVVGGQVSYKIENAPASTPGFLALSLAPLQANAGSLGAVLVNPALMVLFPVTTDGSGSTTQNLGIPSATVLKGQVFYFQAFVFSGTAGGFSSGVLTRICP